MRQQHLRAARQHRIGANPQAVALTAQKRLAKSADHAFSLGSGADAPI
jgi:hypothetical protein